MPRWARNSYRGVETVPQLAPEIRVLPMDELVVYEGGEDELQIEADQDSQIDVCALEEGENIVVKDESISTSPAKKQTYATVDNNASEVTERRSERYRILRRTGNENLTSRMQREAAKAPDVKSNDDYLLEFENAANATGDLVQEEIEVIDQDPHHVNQPFNVMYTPSPLTLNRRATFNDPRSVVNLQELYEEMARYSKTLTIDRFNDIFGTESSMSYPLNVKALMENVNNATADQNAKMIAALAMQVNFLKREIGKLREDIVDCRSATLMRQNYGITGRTFDLNAHVNQQWYIPENPPLKAVDLVKTARDVSLRIGRKNMKTRDIITRFVRAIFDQMIPPDQVRHFTVRDRPSTRGNVLDIGINAKDQIIGVVLDLMGLYDADQLNSHSRVDRANFADFVNQAMKTVVYDMRRITPKSKPKQRRSASVDEQEIEQE